MHELTQVIVKTLTDIISSYGEFSVFILMTLESALIPIPSEVTMPFAGFLVGRGSFNFWVIVTIGSFGNLAGSLMAYYLGYYKGDTWVRIVIKKWGKWLLIKEKEYDRAKSWFVKYGQIVSFTSRLLPVVRTFISLPAGIAKMNVFLFSTLTFAGSFIWSAFLTYLGLKLGQNWMSIEPYFRQFQILIIGIFFLLVFLYIRHHFKEEKKD